MFTFARTTSFADLPGVGVTGGWIQTQAWFPSATPLGTVESTTPTTTLRATFSPRCWSTTRRIAPRRRWPRTGASPSTRTAGDRTGHSSLSWSRTRSEPASSRAASYTYVGAGVPGFTGTKAANGDGPCLLPGGATSTSQTSFQHYLSTVSPTAWDALQLLEVSSPENPATGGAVVDGRLGSVLHADDQHGDRVCAEGEPGVLGPDGLRRPAGVRAAPREPTRER